MRIALRALLQSAVAITWPALPASGLPVVSTTVAYAQNVHNTASTGTQTSSTSGFLRVHQVQSINSASPLRDNLVAFRGIVTASFQGPQQIRGFFVQTPDHEIDTFALSSEGIFVFTASSPAAVVPGDSVEIRGRVTEFNTMTQITSPAVTVLASGRLLPAPAPICPPFDSIPFLERFEGMRVRVCDDLTVTNNFILARFGEFDLSVGGRLFAPTQVALPGATALAQAALNARSLLRVSDGIREQNVDPLGFPHPGLSASNTLRTGQTVRGLTGVLDHQLLSGSSIWKVIPTDPFTFTDSNARVSTPPMVPGDVRVASFNVRNFFTTTGTRSICGPLRNRECRGADNAVEFRRQKAKIVSTILALDVHVLGLQEIENHPTDSALQNLTDALNAVAGAGTWAPVAVDQRGGDAIRVAMLYKPAVVALAGPAVALTSAIDTGFVDVLNRVPFAQSFRHGASGRVFTVVVNHLKSKGSPCDAHGDPDRLDGQGNCNGIRTRAARAQTRWMATDPTGSGSDLALVIGDLNAHGKEDPIRAFADSGWVDLLTRDHGPRVWTYQFNGAHGVLDYALASSSLAPRSRAVVWHINADEPSALDYNLEFKSGLQDRIFYDSSVFRSSDHDPVIVGLDLAETVDLRAPKAPIPQMTVRASTRFKTDASGDVQLALSRSGMHLVRVRGSDGQQILPITPFINP